MSLYYFWRTFVLAFNVSAITSFEQFYKKHHPSLVAYAVYLIGSKEDAIELVNDVFVSVWKKRETLEIADSLKPYLFRAVKNRCINHHQKKVIPLHDISDIDTESSIQTDQALHLKDRMQQVESILQLLPPKCKQVFMMSRIDELSYKEIAEFLDISIKTVENQMSKALKIFRENLKRE